MIGFIACSIALAVLVQNQTALLDYLVSPLATAVGVTVMAASVAGGYLKKLPTSLWHDGFATAGLFVWYSYWQPQFGAEAPMFFLFPIYYALLTATLTLALINKAPYFDPDSVQHLRYLEKISRFDFSMILGLVAASLLITRHYALYPMAMTFFVVRHTMLVCLEIIDAEA
ncbi:hypothetical protein PL263_04730 [Methylomonas sp. EFPC3]|uniref:hypothetical protein n=1 Tax=Methylomonas sp. EFPC3 TaxID=3021710 RepID=UPI002415E9A5|nr:hypothetical protein [Methylomonas sp. EFPC3]WFP51334.1 hypothetical protein PL263_04730 [Methylomonas sp. EFPC3]